MIIFLYLMLAAAIYSILVIIFTKVLRDEFIRMYKDFKKYYESEKKKWLK